MKSTFIKLTLVAAVLAASIGFVNNAVGATPAARTAVVRVCQTAAVTYTGTVLYIYGAPANAPFPSFLKTDLANLYSQSYAAGGVFVADHKAFDAWLNGKSIVVTVGFKGYVTSCRQNGYPIGLRKPPVPNGVGNALITFNNDWSVVVNTGTVPTGFTTAATNLGVQAARYGYPFVDEVVKLGNDLKNYSNLGNGPIRADLLVIKGSCNGLGTDITGG